MSTDKCCQFVPPLAIQLFFKEEYLSLEFFLCEKENKETIWKPNVMEKKPQTNQKTYYLNAYLTINLLK